MKKTILISLIFLFLITGFAQGAGLVPCGGTNEPACQFCDIFVLIKGIIDFVLKLVGVIATLMFIIGGFFFITSGGSPERTASGKKIVTATVIGLAIIFCSYLIVNTVFTFPGLINANFGNGWDITKWFEVPCH
jgi:hypothetical protein